MDGGAAIDDSVNVIVDDGGTLNLKADETIASLANAVGAALNGATLSVGANELTIAGATATTFNGAVTGSGAVLNDGSGKLELTGDGSGFTGLLGSAGTGSEIALTGAGTTGALGLGATAGNTFSTDGLSLIHI